MRDFFIACVVGLLMAGLTLATQTVSSSTELTDYYAENAYKLAEGLNIVNVILVDFRGFDTMVEITVLSVAAIGVYALLKSRPQQSEGETAHETILRPTDLEDENGRD
jgi:multicomponent Na+:H+ antiporter subunit A